MTVSEQSEVRVPEQGESTFEYRHGSSVYVKVLRSGSCSLYRDGVEIDVCEWNCDANKYQSMIHKEQHPLFLVRLAEAHRRRTLLRLANLSPADVVVEVGCEAGSLSLYLAPMCKRLVGVDVDEDMLSKARQKVNRSNVSFVCSSIEGLNIEDDTADVTICAEVLEHVLDPQRAARELVRITRPGGRIVVSVPNEKFILFLKRVLARSGLSRLLGNLNLSLAMGHLHIFTPESLLALFTGNDTRVTVFRGAPFFFNLFSLVQLKERA